MSTTTSNYHPPPPSYYNPSWTLVSQGAEARIWFIPDFISIQQETLPAICKERFKKAYRHESLDKTLTKSRTKAEARNVVKCQKAGIFTPAIYSVHLNFPSACLFMEYIPGCTVKQYLEQHVYTYTNVHAASENDKLQEKSEYIDDDDDDNGEPMEVTVDVSTDSEPITTTTTDPSLYTSHKVIVDTHSLDIAHAMGVVIATMHHANIIHGDLTTSNIMIRNPPSLPSDPSLDNTLSWKPQLVLIDLGLSSTCSSSYSSSSSKMKKDSGAGSVSGQEDKAVDLYVMERAFQTTHPGSEPLISHLLLAYQQTTDTLMLQKGHGESSSSSKQKEEEEGDCVMQNGQIDKSSTRSYGQSILERLNQVRLRGRKRECFG